MKANKNVIIVFFLLVFSGGLFAQQTVYYQSVSPEINNAKELYSNRNYVSALRLFEQIALSSDENSDLRAEAMFYKALCALKLDNGNAEEQIAEFMKYYPESSFLNRALYEQASYQFDKTKYSAVLRTFEGFDKSKLDKSQLTYFYYMRAYSNFQLGKNETALADFALIKEGNSMYAAPAMYYWGHIHYLSGNYETALQEFLRLKENEVFKKVIPFYISQIYYKQGRYRELVDYTLPLINTVTADQQPELARLLGDSYFHLRQFNEAIQFLEFYLSDKNNRGREENYMLGYCYYLGGKEAKAIPYLEIATKGKDELAQNAYYHLADCYVRTADKNKARQAFEAAADFDFDAKIKEDALFNYAKITYELSYSPFNETIKAFDKYISLYPNSERNDVAYDYLVKVYMNTNNYRDALASIENIKVKSPSVKKALQRVSYFRALECFNNLDYTGAIEQFNKSIDAGDFNKTYRSLALYWKAEASYQLSNYNLAVAGYTNFIRSAGIVSLPEYKVAHYNLAYAYFQLKDYSNSAEFFRKYLNLTGDLRNEKVADANNRLGDCYFMARDYQSAVASYENALRINAYEADYALYQKAFCLGLLRDNAGKISSLQTLIRNHPKSSFQDDAMYELGRTYERTNQIQMATAQYKTLLNTFPQSVFLNKALIHLGLIHYNANDFQGSIAYYKQVIERSPNSPETQAALTGIKNNYIETNNVDAFFDYTRKLGPNVQVSANEQDSLTYRAAEKLYMSRDKKARQQFERYLAQFPNGTFVMNAQFYLAEMLFAEGENAKALAAYTYVISQPDNYFTEASLAKAAGLHYNNANYRQALDWFERLDRISSSGNNSLNARIGIMRCQYQLANYQACIDAASRVLNSEKVSDVLKREANYKLALSYYNSGNKEKAFPVLSKLSAETNSAEGAEAKFLVSSILFENQQLKDAENQIMDFIDKNSPHQFWLAKSFILLADIYLKNGDEFQAKHTLSSIIDNYPEKNDGIIATTRQKLQQIEASESGQTQNQSKPLEINIGKGKK